MADDDDAQNAVRRILKERPPEELPFGAEGRLRKRLDSERPAKSAARGARPTRTARTHTVRKKKSKAAR
jgi:hypothetical protein